MKLKILSTLCFAWLLIASPSQAVVLGISGTQFTFDGTPTKLVCTSLFDLTRYKSSDLTALANKGFNCIRGFASWPYSSDPAVYLHDDTADDGTLNSTVATNLQTAITAANALGMAVNLTLSYNALDTDLNTQLKRETFFANACNQFEANTNIYLDLINEAGTSTWANDPAEYDLYLDAARAACPTTLLTISAVYVFQETSIGGNDSTSDETLNGTVLDGYATNSNMDIVSVHLPRTVDWDTKTASRIATVRTRMALLGVTKPLILDEEQRVGWNSAPAAAANFFTACQLAISAGAAGCHFHTPAGYDLGGANTYVGNLTADELTVVNNYSTYLTPGTSPISISASCPKVHVNDGTSVSCTLPQAPDAGDTVIVAMQFANYTGTGPSCLYNSPSTSGAGVRDSQNVDFNLAVETPPTSSNRAYIWYRAITTAPSGSYSVTVTCPAPSWITMSAMIVKGLIPASIAFDVGSFSNGSNGGTAWTQTASQPTGQSNELAVAVIMHDVSGAGTAVTEQAGWSLMHEHEVCSTAFSGHACGSAVYQILTLPQTVSHTWTYAGTVNRFASAIATFRGITGNVGTINRTLTWTDNSSNEASYTVQKRTDQTYPNWVDVALGISPNTQSYLATILDTETGDCWRVTAVNPYGTAYGTNPAEFCVATAPPPPPPPPPPPALQIGGLQTLLDDELL